MTVRNGKTSRVPHFVRDESGGNLTKHIIQVGNDVTAAQLEMKGDGKIEMPEPESGQGESKSVKPIQGKAEC
jgi:hypothetical protein